MKLMLSEAVRETTAALTLLDSMALERLALRVRGARAGEVEIAREPVAAIEAGQRKLRSVLNATRENLRVLERVKSRRLESSRMESSSLTSSGM
jgi:hypothetical protein